MLYLLLIVVVVLRHYKPAVSIIAIVALILAKRWDRNVCILNGTSELLMSQMNEANWKRFLWMSGEYNGSVDNWYVDYWFVKNYYFFWTQQVCIINTRKVWMNFTHTSASSAHSCKVSLPKMPKDLLIVVSILLLTIHLFGSRNKLVKTSIPSSFKWKFKEWKLVNT